MEENNDSSVDVRKMKENRRNKFVYHTLPMMDKIEWNKTLIAHVRDSINSEWNTSDQLSMLF